MAQNYRARVTQVLVFGSNYQGAILVHLFEPQPCATIAFRWMPEKWEVHVAMGQNPNRTPLNIPVLKWVVNSHMYPKMGSHWLAAEKE